MKLIVLHRSDVLYFAGAESAFYLASMVETLLRPDGVAFIANHESWFNEELQQALREGSQAAGLKYIQIPPFAETIMVRLER
eukprot:SAG11_NODE_3122_length_2670_cov_10.586153_2_plen_82_part_00